MKIMKFTADIITCENERDIILSVCRSGPDGIEHEVIIQRGPREFESFEEHPGPKLSCDELGLDLVPGPEKITFSGDIMTIVLSEPENIEVDISKLTRDDQEELKTVARALFRVSPYFTPGSQKEKGR
ncbi:MAG: hypothetical protein JRC66_09190 [Deltaproteobacteria bacterium]|nr:hypothetical protein [Deltaproteobacteria bacterium]MBW2651159.1 hypothetical protein [Deltaproteobacteria bacterium]